MSERVRIANPIYDVVFKYLMQNEKIAKLLIGKIIDKEIVSLDLKPQEQVLSVNNSTVLRIDFAAKIQTKDGDLKTILIEIQKAKFLSDIMRFRSYLATNLKSSYEYKETGILYKESDVENNALLHKKAIPILPIYFLNYNIENENKAPVICVNRKMQDVITGAELHLSNNEFIEALTYDAYIIQIKNLGKVRNALERLLKIFDQKNIQAEDGHVFIVNSEEYPEEYNEVIRELEKAASQEEIRESMDAEDQLLEDFQVKDRQIAVLIEQNQTIEQERQKAEQEKLIFKLHFIEKKTYEEISKILNLSEELVKQVLIAG